MHIVTDADVAAYAQDGYFITGAIHPPDLIAGVKAAFETIWAEEIAAAERTGDAQRVWRARERLFTPFLHLRQPACAAFLKSPAMLAIARRMIGPDADVCYNQAVIKAPRRAGSRPNSFAWHQDSYYAVNGGDGPWSRDIMLNDRCTFQGWVAITRTTRANGALMVLPGKHRTGLLEHARLPETGEYDAVVDKSNPVHVELQPGQMLVFSGLLPHASGPNESDENRMVYQFCYAEPGGRTPPPELANTVFPVLRSGRCLHV